MESADDCGDAWEYDAADALAAFGPGEDGAFADAADDLMDFCPGEDDAFADAAEELLQATAAASPETQRMASSPRSDAAESSPPSSAASSSLANSRVVLPVAACRSQASPGSAAAASSSGQPAKRRRLVGKQSPVQAPSPPRSATAHAQGTRACHASGAARPLRNFGGADKVCREVLEMQGMGVAELPLGEQSMPTTEQFKIVLSLCRKELYQRNLQAAEKSAGDWLARRRAADARLKALSAKDRLDLVESILRKGEGMLLPEEVAACKAWVAWRTAAEDCEQGEGQLVRRKYIMATYFDVKWQSTAKKWEELAGMSACAIENKVKEDPWAKSVIRKLELEVAALVEKVQADNFSAAAEACLQPLHEKKGLQVHLHVVLEWWQRTWVGKWKLRLPSGVKPQHLTAECGQTLGKKRSMSAAPMHYYCQVPKRGQLHSWTDKPAFTEFHVNPRWLNMWIQAQKLDPERARGEFVKCCVNLTSNLQNLDRLTREQEMLLLEKKHETLRFALQSTLGKFKEVPAATQFLAHLQVIRHRYKFLVLYGPSSTGKTSFVRMLTGKPEEVLEVNCASGQEPDLRTFSHFRHKIILFDEATPEMVLRQKKLFQAPNCFIQLGTSTTNCHAYTVFLSGTGLVVCANTWMERLRLLSPADQEWITTNSFVEHIAEPLFLE